MSDGDDTTQEETMNNLFCSIRYEETNKEKGNQQDKNKKITDDMLREQLHKFLEHVKIQNRKELLILPPDYTRFHSQAGKITRMIADYWYDPKLCSSSSSSNNNKRNIQILPALGTHAPMTKDQIHNMFGDRLASKLDNPKETNPFVVHDWRNDVITIGTVPSEMVSKATYGLVNEPWPAQLNRLVWSKRIGGEQQEDQEGQKGKKEDDSTTSPPTKKLKSSEHDIGGGGEAEKAQQAKEEGQQQIQKEQIQKQEQEKEQEEELPPLILSIGQVVPHEVMGMANFNKNLFVGVGGVEAINLSHFIGAVHGMENMMGRADNPLRAILNYASEEYLQKNLDLWYILTVIGNKTNDDEEEEEKKGDINDNKETKAEEKEDEEKTKKSSLSTTKEAATETATTSSLQELPLRGLFIGKDIECYTRACDLSLKLNFNILEKSPQTIVVSLNAEEYHSTWLGNKAIYRTRMAIADGGTVIVLAPGITKFGEDDDIDKMIRQYGYIGTKAIMDIYNTHKDTLHDHLSAIAHLIHGSTEGRFHVMYCTDPNKLTQEEIESVGFQYGNLQSMMEKYNIPKENNTGNDKDNTVTTTTPTPKTTDGWNTNQEGEEFYYISNPALGLWAVQSRFDKEKKGDE